MNIGETIKRLREEAGLTQGELGRRVGVSRASVSQWERGIIKSIKSENVFKLSQALDINPLYLARMTDNYDLVSHYARGVFEESKGYETISDKALQLAIIYDSIPQEQQAYVDSIIEKLKMLRDQPESWFKSIMMGDFGAEERRQFQDLLTQIEQKKSPRT